MNDARKSIGLCALFVFPSWHEGFGLPLLEAMQCGRPVLASNRSSLPEVVGRKDALFDPFDLKDMADKIELALTDASFRQSLADYGLEQSKKFSWKASNLQPIVGDFDGDGKADIASVIAINKTTTQFQKGDGT